MAWLISLYRVAQYRSETMSFGEFANAVLPVGASFKEMLERLKAASGGRLMAHSLESFTADGGHRFLARVAQELGCEGRLQGPLRRVNLTPSPLVASLRQEAARQGYFILTEGARPLLRLLAELWRDKASRTAQNLLNAAGMIKKRTVKLQPGLAHQQRQQRATRRLHILEERDKFIPLRLARKILDAAFEAAEAPLASPAELERLALRITSDWASMAPYLEITEEMP
jgi:hypothetical protein